VYGSDYKEIEMFASRGCLMSCSFCVCRHLYYGQPNWRGRNIQNIIEEIKYLRNKYPQMEGIFFNEEDHNVNKKFIMDLTKAIKENGLDGLKYNAMCGYWSLDKEMLEAMRSAGYYKLRIGIETASEVIAKTIGKRIDIPKVKSVLKIAKDVGIKMYGTFTFGAPGSTKKEDMKTIELMKELVEAGLLNDYQTSICTPQPGTPFYNWSKTKGYLISDNWRDYDGTSCAVVSYPDYSNKEIEYVIKLANKIIARAHQDHYIRKTGIVRVVKEQIAKHGILETFLKGIRFIKQT